MRHSQRGRPPHADVLTPAEWAVLDLVRHGLSRREIAAHRGTSADAVKYHVRNISAKLGLPDARALRHWSGWPSTSALTEGTGIMDYTARSNPTGLGAIGQVSLLVRDVERTEQFYGEVLGLPHLFTFGDLVFFDCDGTRLFLRRVDETEWRAGSILYFMVDDIKASYRSFGEHGIEFHGAPHLIYRDDDTGLEEWMAFFEDPAGNTLALMARVPPVAR